MINDVVFYYAIDPFEGRYVALVGTWKKAMSSLYEQLNSSYKDYPFTGITGFKIVYHAFNTAIKVSNCHYHSQRHTHAQIIAIKKQK